LQFWLNKKLNLPFQATHVTSFSFYFYGVLTGFEEQKNNRGVDCIWAYVHKKRDICLTALIQLFLYLLRWEVVILGFAGSHIKTDSRSVPNTKIQLKFLFYV
jgi:hypothetical protein